jgi:hypothetical protein
VVAVVVLAAEGASVGQGARGDQVFELRAGLQLLGENRQQLVGRRVLQEADDLTGPWNAVRDAFSPYWVLPVASRKFYRTTY